MTTPNLILYGIKNCDSVKKAKKWLKDNGHEFQFHDFRVDGLAQHRLNEWLSQLGWEILLNKRGTSWRTLPDKEKENLDASKAEALMLENPTLIKRPVLQAGELLLVGFDSNIYHSQLNQA